MEKFDLENFPVSESAKNMIASVSDGFYDNSYVGKWLYEVMGQEYDTAREIAEDILNQLFRFDEQGYNVTKKKYIKQSQNRSTATAMRNT